MNGTAKYRSSRHLPTTTSQSMPPPQFGVFSTFFIESFCCWSFISVSLTSSHIHVACTIPRCSFSSIPATNTTKSRLLLGIIIWLCRFWLRFLAKRPTHGAQLSYCTPNLCGVLSPSIHLRNESGPWRLSIVFASNIPNHTTIHDQESSRMYLSIYHGGQNVRRKDNCK